VNRHAVIGGFPLSSQTEAVIPDTVRDLGTFGLDCMIPARCTGRRGIFRASCLFRRGAGLIRSACSHA
jgi:metal-dependent hydrolase (beta-lactamase superfamily II)